MNGLFTAKDASELSSYTRRVNILKKTESIMICIKQEAEHGKKQI